MPYRNRNNLNRREERIAVAFLIATWLLHVGMFVAAWQISWWLLIAIPAYTAVMFVVAFIGGEIYNDFKNEEPLSEKMKCVFIISTVLTLAVPWLLWHMKRYYVENMIRDIYE